MFKCLRPVRDANRGVFIEYFLFQWMCNYKLTLDNGVKLDFIENVPSSISGMEYAWRLRPGKRGKTICMKVYIFHSNFADIILSSLQNVWAWGIIGPR